MSRLSAMDLSFLLMESQNLPAHMASCLIFEPPARLKANYVARLLEVFRSSEVGKPFNQKLNWLEGGIARWGNGRTRSEFQCQAYGPPPTWDCGATR